MARGQRNNNKMTRRRKLQPAVMQMEFVVPAGTTSYIDLSLAASLLNRRAYKQENTNWMVSGFEFLGSAGTVGNVAIGKLQETWVTENAYKKTHALWNKMNDQVLDDEPSIKGKYHDFKIYLDDNMRQQTVEDLGNPTGRILTPRIGGGLTVGDFNGGAGIASDWNWSQLTIPNDPASGVTTEYYIHAVGADTAASKGMIAGYELSRSRQPAIDPSVPDAGWMNDLFDDGEQLEELRENLEDQNDRAPYPVGSSVSPDAYYPGGANEYGALQVHGFCTFSSTTVSGKNTIQGGMFGLGMMSIFNGTDTSLSLLVHLVPGTHRGYLVEELC